MRLIITVFIICLFGKLINCNNNDQSKSAPPGQSASNDKPAEAKPESRQVLAGPPEVKSTHHQYADRSDGSVQHVAINTHNLSPKETAYHNANPNAPIGYISIQPVLAPFSSSHHTPEQQGSTSFISFVKPQQANYRRSFSLTSKLKNFMSSLFSFRDTAGGASSGMPYMASGSSYSFEMKQPPPQFFAPAAAAASQYKPVMFPASGPASGNGYHNKYPGSFGSNHYQSMQPAPSYLRNNGNGMYNGGGNSYPMFPSDSNTVNSYASASGHPNSNAAQLPADGNFNQRLSAAAAASSAENASSRPTVARTIAGDSSSSLSAAGPPGGGQGASSNPVSFATYLQGREKKLV